MSGFDSNFFDYVLGRSGDVIGTLLQQAGAGHGLGQASDPFSNNGYFTNLADRITNNKYQQQRNEAQYQQKQQGQKPPAPGQPPPAGGGYPNWGGTSNGPPSTGTAGPNVAGQIRDLAQERFGPEGAKVVGALLAAEGGLGGAVGDTDISAVGSHGPFQFYGPGGQLDNYARALGVDLPTAGARARSDPMSAATWALDNYLGQALTQGQERGLTGEALLRHALSVQNPGALNSPTHYDRYRSAFAVQDAVQASRDSREANAPPPGPQPGQDTLVSAAQGWIGTPYRLGGFSRGGIDCSALVLAAAQQAGRPLPQGVRTAQQIHNVVQQVRPDLAQPGDLVFFQGTYEGNPGERDTHVGIVTGPGTMISAAGSGVGTQRYTDPYWDSKITGFGRIP